MKYQYHVFYYKALSITTVTLRPYNNTLSNSLCLRILSVLLCHASGSSLSSTEHLLLLVLGLLDLFTWLGDSGSKTLANKAVLGLELLGSIEISVNQSEACALSTSEDSLVSEEENGVKIRDLEERGRVIDEEWRLVNEMSGDGIVQGESDRIHSLPWTSFRVAPWALS